MPTEFPWRRITQVVTSLFASGFSLSVQVLAESIEEQTINGVLDPSPSAKIVQWKVLLHQIGLDVVRTDRVLEFYEDPKNLGKLWDILAVYAWIDEEVGYCQGMSDLCSPMVLLFPDEADAFWCFKCLMRRVRENFRCTNKMMGVQKELSFLAAAMRVIDPKLHRTLEALGGSNYVFAFRMLMVNFRREFSVVDTLSLWKSPDGHIDNVQPDYRAGGRFAKRNIKYGSPRALNEHPSLAVFFVAGILVLLRSKFIKRIQGLDEVVRALNNMSGKIDAYRACQKALKFHKLYLKKVKKSNTRSLRELYSTIYFRLALELSKEINEQRRLYFPCDRSHTHKGLPLKAMQPPPPRIIRLECPTRAWEGRSGLCGDVIRLDLVLDPGDLGHRQVILAPNVRPESKRRNNDVIIWFNIL
ncbi:TBC1 domain family member 15-like [Selaginella moellendorffii]|uniref:TBC1 domain family member 15-like n=1 Tax=Selaginella moellendorffii TaxID=88036 RepID=UPI000D1C924C|nr:TBC1 domain family member 15-like [Selaginella moellendorffii]|eukprot:XP_024534203.1 TBC1 domain family member 15-like [Selaginella moellendorffii]